MLADAAVVEGMSSRVSVTETMVAAAKEDNADMRYCRWPQILVHQARLAVHCSQV